MDPFTVKLLIFCCIIIAILYVSRRFPNSLFTRITFARYGPTPKADETKSHYLFSWAAYSLKWFLFIGLTIYMVMTVADRYFHEQYKENIYFQILFMFGMPLLSLMAHFGSAGCFIKGIYLKLLKKDSYFDSELNDFSM